MTSYMYHIFFKIFLFLCFSVMYFWAFFTLYLLYSLFNIKSTFLSCGYLLISKKKNKETLSFPVKGLTVSTRVSINFTKCLCPKMVSFPPRRLFIRHSLSLVYGPLIVFRVFWLYQFNLDVRTIISLLLKYHNHTMTIPLPHFYHSIAIPLQYH